MSYHFTKFSKDKRVFPGERIEIDEYTINLQTLATLSGSTKWMTRAQKRAFATQATCKTQRAKEDSDVFSL
ncbi:hypothetical protein [Yoonia sp. MH D7]